MKHSDLIAKMRPEPRYSLWCQRNLWDQNDRCLAALKGLPQKFYVYERLSGSRDTLKKKWFRISLVQCFEESIKCDLLRGCRCMSCRLSLRGTRKGISDLFFIHYLDKPFFRQRSNNATAEALFFSKTCKLPGVSRRF